MLKILRLKALNFRSWDRLAYEFKAGLTLLTGNNGAGKTSIRYATQYALVGLVPGLKKGELRRNAENVKQMYALLDCEINGVPTTIKRTMTGTEVTQNGETFGVRDMTFFDQIKVAMGFAFLSSEQAMFVDVQEHKRKEMLNSLIPEVGFLRKKATPRCKELLLVLHGKKVKVTHDIDSLYILVDELKDALRNAESAYDDEARRIAQLEAKIEEGLPMTRAEFQESKELLQNHQDEFNRVMKVYNECTEWVTKALKHNERVSAVGTEIASFDTRISNATIQRQGLIDRLEDAKRMMQCPKCHGKVVCESCGSPVILEDRSAEFEAEIAKLTETIAHLQGQRDAKYKQLSERQAVISKQDIANTEKRAEAAKKSALEHREAGKAIEEDIKAFEIAEARIQEISKITVKREHLTKLGENVQAIRNRVAMAEEGIARKSRTVDVIEKNIMNMNAAVSIMYEKMPAVYYNIFLTKLSDFCQFLLAEISDMKISLGATEDGISIIVDDKEVKQLSSGERQRVRIATTLAFSLMAPKTDTLFIDEVFDTALDAEGVEDLAKLLSGHIRTYFPKIVMVSHRSDIAMSVGADRVVAIMKGKDDLSTLKEINYGQ